MEDWYEIGEIFSHVWSTSLFCLDQGRDFICRDSMGGNMEAFEGSVYPGHSERSEGSGVNKAQGIRGGVQKTRC